MQISRGVTPKVASRMVENGEAVIVDVRELVEYNDEHVKDSWHMPLSEVQLNIYKLSEMECESVIMLCRVGRRSQMACEIALAEGVSKRVYNLDGGINAWKDQGLSVVSMCAV